MLTKIKVDNMSILNLGAVFGRRNKRQDNSGMNDLTSRVSALEEAGATAGMPPPPPAAPQSPVEPMAMPDQSMGAANVEPNNFAPPANMQGGRPQGFATAGQQEVGNALFQKK